MPNVLQRNASAGHPLQNQRGTYLIFSAIVLLVLIGFAALGVEVGRWYAIQGELSKSIDGAAFAGAKNANNPNIDVEALAQDVAQANFPDGILGTDYPTFTISQDGKGKVTVDGATNSLNSLAQAVDRKYVKTRIIAEGAAKLRRAEIALVLDVSGSMRNAIGDLRDGAKLFVENFEDQEDRTKMALIIFASGVETLFDLDHGFASNMTTHINGLKAVGGTNAEYAFTKATALPWESQSGVPSNEKNTQAVIFFSDGNPTAFRGEFKRNNTWYEAAVPSSFRVRDPEAQYEKIADGYLAPSGDGLPKGDSACGSGQTTVKWKIFEDPDYGVDSNVYPPFNGYDPEHCTFSKNDLWPYVQAVARQKTLDNAKALKAKGIAIYAIGLGKVDRIFLAEISSGSDFNFYTSDSAELEGIFQKIANKLKLVLVK